FNDTATTEIYTLSLHDALPISLSWVSTQDDKIGIHSLRDQSAVSRVAEPLGGIRGERSKNVLKAHSRAGHPLEFLGSVELVDIANVGAEEHLPSSLRE